MRLGYARVSQQDQNLDLQLNALRDAGCSVVFEDFGISGQETNRPGLRKALARLRKGDTFVVWRLDRLGRSNIHLIQTVRMLKKRGVEFLSLNEAIDTASTAGTLIFHLFAAFAEFERCLISDRTIAGLAAARAKGKILGRRRRLTDDQSAALFHAIVFEKEPPAVVAERFGVHPRTANRYVARTLERSIQSSGSGKGR